MTTKFIHLRKISREGIPKEKGGMTLAYDITDNSINYTFAWCSDKDHYNKAIGRAVASGRLDADKHTYILPRTDKEPLVHQVLRDFESRFKCDEL